MLRQVISIIITLIILSSLCWADDTTVINTNNEAPKIFIDCQSCDMDYFRQEIGIASLVRDRKQAEVHILVTRQRTGSNGREYTLEFIGQEKYKTMSDTLKYISQESDTDDITRKGLIKIIRMGLVRFIAKTDLAKYVEINFNKPSEEIVEFDKWKNWVFTIDANSWFNGQKTYRSINIYGNIRAQKVTKKNRFIFGMWGNYNEDKYDYEDTHELSISRSRGADVDLYFGLNDHWSVGLSSSVYTSTYSNKKLSTSLIPRIEYNLFPYNESNRRQFRFGYLLIGHIVDYDEITIYNKTSENLISEQFRVTAEFIQPWGEVEATLSGLHYFHDFDKTRIQLYGDVSVRLFEGFSLEIDGSISRIRDQLSLRRGDADEADVLLRQTELATSYSYYASFGFSYSFGSTNNNVVNPRFGF